MWKKRETNGGKIKEKMEIFIFCEWKLEVDREDRWTGSTGRERKSGSLPFCLKSLPIVSLLLLF